MATIKHLVIPLLLTTLLICRKERQFDKKNKAKWTRIHPIAAPKMGFSAMGLLKSQMESQASSWVITTKPGNFASFYLGEVHLGKRPNESWRHMVITMYHIVIEGYDNDRLQASCRSWHSCSFDSFSSTSDYTIYIAFLLRFLLRFHIPIFMVDNNSVGERKWLQSKKWALIWGFPGKLVDIQP